MARHKLELQPHLSADDLYQRYRACRDAKEARRWHVLWLISQGHTTQAAADTLGLSVSWVRRIVRRYNAEGPASLRDGHQTNPGGRRPRLNAIQRAALLQALQHPPADGGLWTGPKVARWIAQTTLKRTYAQLGWVYLREVGYTLKVPRRKHANAASAEEQAEWKKN
jgi:transposase